MKAPFARTASLILIASILVWAVPSWPAVFPADPFDYTRTSSFEYDPVTGALQAEIVEPDNPEICVRTQYGRTDGYGNITSITTSNCPGATGDALFQTRTASATFGTNGVNLNSGQFETVATNALNHQVVKEYDPRFGAVTKTTSPNRVSMSWEYDGFGRKIVERRADGTLTRWNYNYCSGVTGLGVPCSAKVPAAAWFIEAIPQTAAGVQIAPKRTSFFDVLGREIAAFNQMASGGSLPYTIVVRNEYDRRSRVSATTRPQLIDYVPNWTRNYYDELNRIEREERPDPNASGGIAVSTVTHNGLIKSATNALGQIETREKNAIGQLIRVTNDRSHSLTYQYDAFGNLIKTVDALGNVTTMTYDIQGNKRSVKDPDAGLHTYSFNALGEIVSETNARKQQTTIVRDAIGRVTARLAGDLKSYWSYDVYADGSACANGLGKLCETHANNDFRRRQTYDSLGRPIATQITNGLTYTTKLSYDVASRVDVTTYPTGFATRSVYDAFGAMREIQDAATGASLWKALLVMPDGQIQSQRHGANRYTTNVFDAWTGRLTSSMVGDGSRARFAYREYRYDALSNLKIRDDVVANVIETFAYDRLNRLETQTTTAGSVTRGAVTWTHDAIGNISSQTEVGVYTYNPSGANSVRPHAVASIAGANVGGFVNPRYSYDDDGNLISIQSTGSNSNGAWRNLSWTTFGMPATVASHNGTAVAFRYDTEHTRVREEFTRVANGVTKKRTVTSIGGGTSGPFFEVEEKEDGTFEYRHFVNGVALIKSTASTHSVPSDPTPTALANAEVQYWHRDPLGSVMLVTNQSGAVIETLAYDPYGSRRFPNGAADPGQTLAGQTTQRGFTGHEHLAGLGFVHMNGRIFDPAIGRFASADPYIQLPDNLQSYNRYSYVLNNPFRGTDPSGYLFGDVGDAFGDLFEAGIHLVTRPFRVTLSKVSDSIGQILVAVGSYYCGPYAPLCAAAGSYENARAHGASSSDARMAAVVAGMTSSAMDHVGTITNGHNASMGYFMTTEHLANMAGHALVGCLSAEASHGDCTGAAYAGAIGSLATPLASGSNKLRSFTVVTTAGGLGSLAAGGTFEDGAKTAAYGYIFNDLGTFGFKLRPPEWALKFFFGDDYLGQGGGVGLCFSWPTSSHDPTGEFDVGFYFDVDGGGWDKGSGYYSTGFTLEGGNLREHLQGDGMEGSFTAYGAGLTMQMDRNMNPTGMGLHIGPGYNLGLTYTHTEAFSLRNGLDWLFDQIGSWRW